MVDLGVVAALAGLIELRLQLGQVGFDVLQGSGLLGLIQLRAPCLQSIPPFGVNPAAERFPCQSVCSPRVRVIRRFRLLPLLAVVLLASCRSNVPSPQERERLAEQQRLLKLCERHRPQLPALLKRFEVAEQQLASIRQTPYTPSAPPKPLDPEEQRRLTMDDQQTEQDLYEQAVDAWQQREAVRRDRWEAEHTAREQAAVDALTAAASALRQIHAELLLSAEPPRLNSPEVERFSSCQPEQFR
ncbi:MAG: hypothetical protein RLZZ11_976 [Cyanobacteriota bacterium]